MAEGTILKQVMGENWKMIKILKKKNSTLKKEIQQK